ncbi:lipase 3-like [Bacillus rossius redtenbacheri]|uniref:lipase 3-like n=1 Tax=Bacillus rossius redtenbacheri TaxID=93214 RepID=UPI002FDE6952
MPTLAASVASSVMMIPGTVATCLLVWWMCVFATPDLFLDTEQLVQADGYTSQTHHVVTEDGYELTLHRLLPHQGHRSRALPVLMQHGIFHSSADFVVPGPGHALGYALSDAGYDVWLANSRGNFYSRRHLSLATNTPQYWNFSWHQMGQYDLPAVIDFILNETRSEALFYVGHSMGAAVFFAMLHLRPEYNRKIRVMFGLAPASYMHHGKSPVTIPIFKSMHINKILLDRLGVGEILPRDSPWHQLVSSACGPNRVLMQPVCMRVLGHISGYNLANLNKTRLDINLSHFPAGSSRNTAAHFGQNIISGKFLQFDYGREGNLVQYGQEKPLPYDLGKVTAPVSLYCGTGDLVIDCQDVERLFHELTQCRDKNLTHLQRYSHLDFLWGIDAMPRLYSPIIHIMDQYS